MSADVAHRVPTAAYQASKWFDIPAVALCGHVWHPSHPNPDLPECEPCATRFASIPTTYTYVNRDTSRGNQ